MATRYLHCLRKDVSLRALIRCYDGSTLVSEIAAPLDRHIEMTHDSAQWDISAEMTSVSGEADAVDYVVRFRLVSGQARECAVGVSVDFDGWSTENYVTMPGGVYAGNRFESLSIPYPPLITDPGLFGPDTPTIITDVPRLNIGAGASKVQLLTRDLTTPAVGIQFPAAKMGFWLLTDHATELGDSGFELAESDDRATARLTLRSPGVREKVMFKWNQMNAPSVDRGADLEAGAEIVMRFRIYTFACESICGLFDRFLTIRKALEKPGQPVNDLPFSVAWDILEEKHNRENWREAYGFYAAGTTEDINQMWQPGWCGGGMMTLPVLMLGKEHSRERAFRNLDFIFGPGQAANGFLYGISDGKHFWSDGFAEPHPHGMHLIRKSSDVLLFAVKQFQLLEAMGETSSVKAEWKVGARRLADAFARLWERYGQFGQFVNIETGDILIGGTTSASTAPGGLALAAQYFDSDAYLGVAKSSARSYFEQFVTAGYTCGGPGEILACPDSESAFGLLESFVILYEVTGDDSWVTMAEHTASQCASWVNSYDYPFPAESEFGRLGIHSGGSVMANVQNKHCAPGICTLSGDSLFRLFRATGNSLYLDLLKGIAHGITQYLSRADRPVGKMLKGWMCERVNLSDWAEGVGEVFNGSCWCEVSCMLTYAEVPGVYVQPDTGLVWVNDHVEARIVTEAAGARAIEIMNPTEFALSVSVFVEESADCRRPLSVNPMVGLPRIEVMPSETVRVTC
jgi:hypothetical protein